MKPISPSGLRRPLLAFLAMCGSSHLAAQTAATDKVTEESPLVLSPFTVQTETDVGYEASSSLAGTGLNTKLTDLGASVSVITSKFMEDTGATNLSDILVYQTNMEVKGFGGNLSGISPSLAGVTGEPTLSNGPVGTRVRGLAEATQARNFFRSIIPMESYNTDRVEINRGANALLFGVGSPAGIINTSTAAAELNKNFAEVELSGGSYGSFRGSFDFNPVVIRNELAFRVAAVRNNEKYQQDFAYTDTDRRYVAGAWDIKALRNRGLLDSTVLRASFESGGIESNNPRLLPPSDRLASWFDSTLPAGLKALGASGKISYDPGAAPIGVFSAAQRNATIGTIENVNRSATFVFQDVYATAPRDNIPTSPSGQPLLGRAFVTNNYYFPWTGLTGTAQAAYSREMSRVRQDYAYPDQAFYTAENLVDPSTFNFFDNLLVGPNSLQKSHLESIDASLQQLFLHRTIGVEVAYNRQRWRESMQNLFSESAPYIAIDVNTKMWTGENNPNYGRPFISTTGVTTWNEQEVETTRAKLFYELNLQEKLNNRLGGVLGRHVVSLLGQREKLTTEAHNGGRLFYTPDFWVNGTNQSRLAAQSKQPVVWVYLGPSLANANSPSGANLRGLQQNLMNFQTQVNGKGVVLTRTPAPSAAVAQQAAYAPVYIPIDLEREDEKVNHTATAATLNQRTLDSQAISLQSNWLNDHLVSTVGWRKEKSKILGINAPIDPNGEAFALVNDSAFRLSNPSIVPQRFSDTLFAWSGVAKTPASWLKHVPVINALNAYYGESENFNPPGGRTVDTFGVAIAPPHGITKEKGIYFEAFNGRFTARINFFRTTQTGSLNSTIGNLAGTIVNLHGQAYSAVQNGWVAAGPNGFPVGYVAPPQALLDLFSFKIQNGTPSSVNPGVQDTSDFVTDGKEFEVMFRPTRGLSFVANVSEQESVRTNTGSAMRKLLFSTATASGKPLAQEWLSTWANFIPLSQASIPRAGDPTDPNMFSSTFQRAVLNPFNTAVSADGAVVQELRKWRANFVGNYDFQNGRLKGFGIGAGVRWLDKSALGYPVANFRADLTPVPAGGETLPSDIRISDVRHPYYGPTETRYDGWISYHTKIFQGKVGVKVQLNVRNIFTHNELVPAFINPDGTVPVWSIAEGRKFTLTSKFTF